MPQIRWNVLAVSARLRVCVCARVECAITVSAREPKFNRHACTLEICDHARARDSARTERKRTTSARTHLQRAAV